MQTNAKSPKIGKDATYAIKNLKTVGKKVAIRATFVIAWGES